MGPLETLCRQIQDGHHAFLRKALPRLAALLSGCLAAAPDPRRPRFRTVTVPLRELTENIDSHMIKEERILFPVIIAAEQAASPRGSGAGGREDTLEETAHGSILASVRPLMFEHERIEGALRRLESAVAALGDPPAEDASELAAGVAALAADLREHIRKEEEDLFVAALRLENAIFLRHGQTSPDKEDAG